MILSCLLAASFSALAVEGEYSPAFSKDGQFISYHVNNQQATWDVMIQNLQTGEKLQVTKSKAMDVDTTWSPDGNEIAFTSNRSGQWDLYIYNLKSKQTRLLDTNETRDIKPIWSPDGKSLAFTSNREDQLQQLYLYDFETNKTKRLSFTDKSIGHPSWSQDGKKIIFEQWFEKKSAIYSLTLKTKKVEKLYQAKGNVYAGRLINDQLVVADNSSGNWDLVKVDLTTGKDEFLIKTPLDEDKTGVDYQRKLVAVAQDDERRVTQIKIYSFEQLGL